MIPTPEVLNTLTWHKAQISVNNGACVEVAHCDGRVLMRSSKSPKGPVLVFTPAEWCAFLDGAKKNEFDNVC
jgi:hypothetical protein